MLKLHDPELVKGGMVFELWQDGEITLTKAGDLFRSRSLLTIEPATLTGGATREAEIIHGLKEGGANRLGRNYSVFFEDQEAAFKIRLAMRG